MEQLLVTEKEVKPKRPTDKELVAKGLQVAIDFFKEYDRAPTGEELVKIYKEKDFKLPDGKYVDKKWAHSRIGGARVALGLMEKRDRKKEKEEHIVPMAEKVDVYELALRLIGYSSEFINTASHIKNFLEEYGEDWLEPLRTLTTTAKRKLSIPAAINILSDALGENERVKPPVKAEEPVVVKLLDNSEKIPPRSDEENYKLLPYFIDRLKLKYPGIEAKPEIGVAVAHVYFIDRGVEPHSRFAFLPNVGTSADQKIYHKENDLHIVEKGVTFYLNKLAVNKAKEQAKAVSMQTVN